MPSTQPPMDLPVDLPVDLPGPQPPPGSSRAHSTEPAAAASPLHVEVDLNRCQAYAQCCFMAPEVFMLHGEEALWYDPAPDAAQWEHVLRAAAACPVQAIVVEQSAATSRHQSRKHTRRSDHREAPHATQRS